MVSLKRWYDKEPVVAQALWDWERLPQVLQVHIAKYIITLLQEQRQGIRITGTYDKVGRLPSKRVLGLYLASLKRRWHDKDPVIRRAFNSLVFIEQDDLIHVAEGIIRTRRAVLQETAVQKALSDDDLSSVLSHVFKNLEERSAS